MRPAGVGIQAGLVKSPLPGLAREKALGFKSARTGEQHRMAGAFFIVGPFHGGAGPDLQLGRLVLVFPDADLDRLRQGTQGRMALQGGVSSAILMDGPPERIEAAATGFGCQSAPLLEEERHIGRATLVTN